MKKERYVLELKPDDYRPGASGKRMESVNVNKEGYVVAGTSKGDVFVWRIDFSAFKKNTHRPYSCLSNNNSIY